MKLHNADACNDLHAGNAVSIGGKQKPGPGLALLNLSAWIRRQEWLRTIYRRLPMAWRMGVSQALARRAGERVRFTRTSRWALAAPLPALAQPVAPADVRFGAAAGVNIFAYARGQFGLAESARLYARALLGAGYPVAVYDIALDMAHSMGDTSLEQHIGTDTPYGINLVFVNPDYMDAAIATIGRERLGNRYTIGCWFWELETFPREWLAALAEVDEVMVSSAFIHEVVGRATDKPLLHVPLPVLEMPDSGLTRSDFGLRDDAFLFLNSFDFNSFQARKNPLATIRAFRNAFDDGRRDVQLLIKSSNGHRHPDRLRELLDAAGGDERILVRDDVIDRAHVQALQRCADAYISLHRSEGFGLGLAECMRLGKPVIATAWSGNMEFMTPENSCLVDYEMVGVSEGEYLYHEGQRWAQPNVEHAAAYMRRLVDEPGYAAGIGRQASSDILEKLSSQAVAGKLIQRLAQIASAASAPNASGRGADADPINEGAS